MMKNDLPCPACGAPNPPEADRTHMACAYCGANLVIPKVLQRKSIPEKNTLKPESSPGADIEAGDILRKVQPLAIRAWNLYALWTWVRRVLPSCLILFAVGIILCLITSTLPFILNAIR